MIRPGQGGLEPLIRSAGHQRLALSRPVPIIDERIAARRSDPAMSELIRGLVPAAMAGGPLLLLGESGVGKEFFAREIHKLRWGREDGFAAVVAVGLDEDRLQKALLSAGSSPAGALTLFIRGIEHLSPAAQAFLARWLIWSIGSGVESPFLVAASQHPSPRRLAEVLADRDLRTLIALRTLVVPPVRARSEDRLVVAVEVLDRISRELDCPVPPLASSAWGVIRNDSWPGNVRQILNRLRQAMLVAEPDAPLRLSIM